MWMELLTVAADDDATTRWMGRRNYVAAASVNCDVGGEGVVVVAVIAAVPQLCPAANYSTAPSRPRSSSNAAAAVPATTRVPEEVDVGGGSSGCFFGASLPLAKVHHHPHGDVSVAGQLTLLLLSHRRHWKQHRPTFVASEAVLV